MQRLSRRKARARLVALTAALSAWLPGLLHAQGPFSSLTFFGDSYVDTGNLSQITGLPQPPTPP